jgi:dUTPase
MKIRIVNKSENNLFSYSADSSSGMDLRANIDADYRGEVCIILINPSDKGYIIKDVERIM